MKLLVLSVRHREVLWEGDSKHRFILPKTTMLLRQQPLALWADRGWQFSAHGLCSRRQHVSRAGSEGSLGPGWRAHEYMDTRREEGVCSAMPHGPGRPQGAVWRLPGALPARSGADRRTLRPERSREGRSLPAACSGSNSKLTRGQGFLCVNKKYTTWRSIICLKLYDIVRWS